MRLDLSGGDWPDGVPADALEAVAAEIRRPFVELVDRLSEGRDEDIDWWVTPLASRNTYACPLYLRLCRLVLARRLLAAGGIREVVADSPALAQAVGGLAGAEVRVSIVAGASRLAQAFGVLRRYTGACYHAASQFLFSRLMLPRKPLPADVAVLVDTFLYTDSFAGGRLRDRHYPGMTDFLTADERARVFFIPSYYRIRSYRQFYRQLRQLRSSLVLKEDVLGAADYLFALAHPFRLRWPRGRIDFLGIDVEPLVREAMLESFAASGAVEGLLRYRAAQRLQEGGLAPRRIVEWFENQEIDHGANAGWRRFFPAVPVAGYQGFLASRHYLCMFPTTREAQLRLLPERLAVMGTGLAAAAREFCPQLAMDVAPAFRFESVWRTRNCEPAPGAFTVLVALPILPQESAAVMALAAAAAGTLADRLPLRFRVKPHPTWGRSELGRLAESLPADFQLVQGDFESLLDQAHVLVGAASSTCVHAIVRGVPVAIAAQPGNLAQNPIPGFVDASLWAVCYTGADLAQALNAFAAGGDVATERRRELGRSLCERMFEPVTAASVRRFLGFDEATPDARRETAAN